MPEKQKIMKDYMQGKTLNELFIQDVITERYYQKEAVFAACDNLRPVSYTHLSSFLSLFCTEKSKKNTARNCCAKYTSKVWPHCMHDKKIVFIFL